jgi:H/ACA ribonucleoprotein complex subunit 1
MARNFNGRREQSSSSSTVELGKVVHTCQKQLVISLVCTDIPYPNSPVLSSSKKIIGRVDEVLGQLNDPYAAVALSAEDEEHKKGEMLFAYADKFIPKRRFLPRAEVEKKKEEKDSAKNESRNRDRRTGDRKLDGRRMGGDRSWDRNKSKSGWGRRNDESFNNRRPFNKKR